MMKILKMFGRELRGVKVSKKAQVGFWSGAIIRFVMCENFRVQTWFSVKEYEGINSFSLKLIYQQTLNSKLLKFIIPLRHSQAVHNA